MLPKLADLSGMSHKLVFIVFILIILIFSGGTSAQDVAFSEDSLRQASQDKSDSSKVIVVPYQHVRDEDSTTPAAIFSQVIENKAAQDKIAYSLGDLLIGHSGFGVIRLGSYGQSFYLTSEGMPIRNYLLQDFVFDYAQFALPINGLIDARLIGLENGEKTSFDRFQSSPYSFPLKLCLPSLPDTGAITSIYMLKGDYRFSNTMVRFGSAVQQRMRLGFTAGFDNSTGYLFDTKKELENFRLYAGYQFSAKYQMQSDLTYYSWDDQVRFMSAYSGYRGNSNSDFFGFSLALSSQDSAGPADRIAFVYQKYVESIRGLHPKCRQEIESYRAKITGQTDFHGLKNAYAIEPQFRRVTFDPGYNSYSGLLFHNQSVLACSPKLDLNMTLGGEIDKYRDRGLSITLGSMYRWQNALAFMAQVYRTIDYPHDFELFAHSPRFENAAGQEPSRDYMFTGVQDLRNARYLGYAFAVRMSKSQFSSEIYFRQADIANTLWWREVQFDDSTYKSVPSASDADWLSGGFELGLDLPRQTKIALTYTYSKLESPDRNQNYALTPRHNLFASVQKGLYLKRFDLHLLTQLEGECHSRNYASAYNPQTVGGYMILNFAVHFKIKSLTIFYNLDNLFDKPYRDLYNYEIRRGVWWGFLWNLIN